MDSLHTTQPQGLPEPRLVPLTEWPARYGSPPLGGLRHLVFHSRTNGFDKVIRRIGKRIYLDVIAFHLWVDEQNEISVQGGKSHV
jgi:hypothetical protein